LARLRYMKLSEMLEGMGRNEDVFFFHFILNYILYCIILYLSSYIKATCIKSDNTKHIS